MTNHTEDEIPDGVLALSFEGQTKITIDPKHEKALAKVCEISKMLGESVRATFASSDSFTFRAEVTPYGMVGLIHRTGDPFSKSVRRWCWRYAQRCSGLPKAKPAKTEKPIDDEETRKRSARLATPRDEVRGGGTMEF